MVLNLSVSLDEIRDNPVSAAIYRGASGSPDVIGACRKVLGVGGSEIVAADAEAPMDLFRRAAELVEQGRLEEASNAFDAALQRGETSEGWSDWATVQLGRNKVEAAELGLRRAMELDKDNAQAAAKLGILLAGRGNISEAVGLLEQGIGGVEGERRAAIEELLRGCREKQAAPVKVAR
jgi:tetratricopeptide (TPR) repeat protein